MKTKDEKEILITMKGVVLLTFRSNDNDAKKVRLYKELLIQKAIANGLTMDVFQQYTGAVIFAIATPKAQVLAYLQNVADDGGKIESFTNWLFECGYLNDNDVIQIFGGMSNPTHQSKLSQQNQSEYFTAYRQDKEPYEATQGEFEGHLVSVKVTGTDNNDGFLVTLTIDDNPWTYPDPMTIEEAADCVKWLQERHDIPWSAIEIPVADIIRQADKSIACRRLMKQAEKDGLSVNEMVRGG